MKNIHVCKFLFYPAAENTENIYIFTKISLLIEIIEMMVFNFEGFYLLIADQQGVNPQPVIFLQLLSIVALL